jgi:hypothetical protein
MNFALIWPASTASKKLTAAAGVDSVTTLLGAAVVFVSLAEPACGTVLNAITNEPNA